MSALRSKYKVNSDWLGKDLCKNASQSWKAIERMKTFISNGAYFLVGDGALIDIWKDPWVPWLSNFTPSPKDSSTATRPLVVSCLIN